MTSRSVARPLRQDFLHELLSEEMRVRQLHRVEFFPRANVEQMNRVRQRRAVRKFARLDLHRAIGRVADEDVFDHFIDVRDFHCARKRRPAFRPG